MQSSTHKVAMADGRKQFTFTTKVPETIEEMGEVPQLAKADLKRLLKKAMGGVIIAAQGALRRRGEDMADKDMSDELIQQWYDSWVLGDRVAGQRSISDYTEEEARALKKQIDARLAELKAKK